MCFCISSSNIHLKMKLLLVAITAIAVLSADSREFSKEPVDLGTDNKIQLFQADADVQEEENNHADGTVLNNYTENLDSDFDDHSIKEERMEGNRKELRRSKCKARNACVVMGGFCVTNATQCGGRLVSEGCKGANCQCCVPGTLEAKLDLLEEAINNIYSNISSLLESKCDHKGTTLPTPSTTDAPTTTAQVATSPIVTTTEMALTTREVPAGFERFNGRIIRRTISSDTRGSYTDAISFCDRFGAKPFIPVSLADFALVKQVRYSLPYYMWLPANDVLQEGTLRWYNGNVVSNISLFEWWAGQELYQNSETYDYLHYGSSGIYFTRLTDFTSYPPICEIV